MLKISLFLNSNSFYKIQNEQDSLKKKQKKRVTFQLGSKIKKKYKRGKIAKEPRKEVNKEAVKAYLVRRQLRLDLMKQDQLIRSLISSDSDDEGGIRPRKSLAELRSEHRA